ncbi:MAG: hypothetical protein HQK69_02850 [Desulfamplus sp.]|nr:hypothetical protein [Desulfamplus sp.]
MKEGAIKESENNNSEPLNKLDSQKDEVVKDAGGAVGEVKEANNVKEGAIKESEKK